MQLAAFDVKLLALRVESEALGQRKFDGFLYPVHFANRHRAQRFQPVDDLLNQYFRSRRAGCQAHAAFAVKPDFLQLAGVIDHVSLGAQLGRQLAQPVAVRACRTAHHDQNIDLRAEQLDRILPVLSGVANILLLGFAHLRKPGDDGRADFGCIVNTQGGLCHHCQALGLRGRNARHISHVFHQVNAAVQLAHGALDFGMPFVANHDEFITFFVQFGHFDMNFGDQRTGGIENPEPTGPGFFLHRPADAVGAEHQGCVRRYIGKLFNKNCALGLEVVHDIGVVDYFMAHINRCAEFAQRPLDDFNGPVNTGAKAARLSQQNFFKLRI